MAISDKDREFLNQAREALGKGAEDFSRTATDAIAKAMQGGVLEKGKGLADNVGKPQGFSNGINQGLNGLKGALGQKLGRMMPNGAAGAAQAGGAAGKAAAGLSQVASMAGKFAGVFGAVVTVGMETYKAFDALVSSTDAFNKRLSKSSAAMGAVQAQSDIRSLMRDMKQGNELAESAQYFNEQNDDFNDSMAEISTLLQEIYNNGLGSLLELMNSTAMPLLQSLVDIIELISKTVASILDSLGGVVDWIVPDALWNFFFGEGNEKLNKPKKFLSLDESLARMEKQNEEKRRRKKDMFDRPARFD